MTVDQVRLWRNIDGGRHHVPRWEVCSMMDALFGEIERLTADRNLEKQMRKQAENSLAQLQEEVAQGQR